MSLLPNLEALVVDAAERHPVTPPRESDAPAVAARGLRAWASRHLLLVGLLVAGGAGTATAAVLALSGEPSPPMEGRIQLGTTPTDAFDYRIRVAPGLSIGQPTWCATTTVIGDNIQERGVGGSCSPAPTTRRHTIAGGLTGGGKAAGMLLTLVVDDGIAGVRLWDGKVLLTRAEPSLPQGYRAVVARISERAFRRAYRRDGKAWELLDPSGRVVAEPAEDDRSADTKAQLAREIDGWPSASAFCSLTPKPGAQLRLPSRSWVLKQAPRPAEGVRQGAFLSCATVDLPTDRVGEPRIAVLLDARAPGRRAPADLPDQSPAGSDGIVEAASPSIGLPAPTEPVVPVTLTAKRIGNAWLVVDGGTRAERLRLIDGLEVRLAR